MPGQCEPLAVGLAAVTRGTAGDIPAPETPRGRVATFDRVGEPAQPKDLRAEGVQPVPACRQGPQDLFDFGGVLAAAYAAHTHQKQRGQVHAMPLVRVGAPLGC